MESDSEFSKMISQQANIHEWLGVSDRLPLIEAEELIRGGLPQADVDTRRWAEKNLALQVELTNLHSRIKHIWAIKDRDLGQKRVELIDIYQEYNKDDRPYVMMTDNPAFLDLSEQVSRLDLLCKHIEKVVWVLKGSMDRIKGEKL